MENRLRMKVGRITLITTGVLIAIAVTGFPSKRAFQVMALRFFRTCSGCSLHYIQLTHLNLNGADLRNTDLRGANLEFVNLNYADLSGANLRGARLSNVTVKETKFCGATMMNNVKSSVGC